MNKLSARTDNVLRWFARLWSLPAILFIFGEVLFPHAGSAPVPFIEWFTLGLQIAAVFGLALAWRYEILGGTFSIITMLSSFILLSITREAFMWQAGLVWLGFVIVPAAIFLFCGLRTKPPGLKTI